MQNIKAIGLFVWGMLACQLALGQTMLTSPNTHYYECDGTTVTYEIPWDEGEIPVEYTTWTLNPTTAGTITGAKGNPNFRKKIAWTFPSGVNQATLSVYIKYLNPFPGQGTGITFTYYFHNNSVIGGNLFGSTTACPGQVKNYAVNLNINQSNITSYNWNLPTGVTQQNSTPNGQAIEVLFGPTFTGGNISVTTTTSNCGTTTNSLSKTITLIPSEPIAGNISGKAQVCEGTTERYTVVNDPNPSGYTYQWFLPPNTQQEALGPNGSYIDVKFLPGFSGGTLSVKANGTCGLSTNSLTQEITIPPGKVDKVVLAGSSIQLNTQYLYFSQCPALDACNQERIDKLMLKLGLDFYGLNNDYSWAVNGKTATVSLSVTPYTQQGAQTPFTVDFNITDEVPLQWYIKDYTQDISNLTAFEIRITNISVHSSIQNNLRLTLSYVEEKSTGVDGIQSSTNITGVSGISNPPTRGSNLEQNFYWQSSCNKVSAYQFQLVRVFTDAPPTTEQWANALTLELEAASLQKTQGNNIYYAYNLVVAEGTGKYYWRVRPLGNWYQGGVTDPRNLGSWDNVTGNMFDYTQPMFESNWIYSRVFSEGNRVSESITFANGLFQVRQKQTRLQSTRQIIGLQSLQDYSGRDAWTSLPFPIFGQDKFTFNNNLVLNSSQQLYHAEDFDEDLKLRNPSSVFANNQSYYSGLDLTLTGNITNLNNQSVPSAEGYPFVRTLFNADGRVKEQGGVGNTHRLGGNHTIRTFYTGVADQELLMIFGKEAPYSENVHKIITIDQNKVSSVSYQTKDGQVIATALSTGTSSPALDPLPSRADAKTIVEYIENKTAFLGIGSSSSKPLVLEIDQSISIYYRLSPETVEDICNLGTLCQSCDYRVQILLHQDEGPTQSLVDQILHPGDCASVANFEYNNINYPLNAGSYVLEKRITSFNAVPATNTPQGYEA